MRLDRYLSQATGLSRSQVRKPIAAGRVRVEGIAVRDAGHRVDPGMAVTLAGKPVQLRGPVYLMLNKPPGVVCATEDAEHSTVLDLLPAELRLGVHPAGRLDIDTTGLVLLTDDGDWSHRVTSPRRRCAKIYQAELAEPLVADAEERFEAGLLLRGEPRPTLPARLERETDLLVRVTLTEGRYHQVKRMFAALGNRVTALQRLRIGAVALDGALAPGGYRMLTAEEINSFGAPHGSL